MLSLYLVLANHENAGLETNGCRDKDASLDVHSYSKSYNQERGEKR